MAFHLRSQHQFGLQLRDLRLDLEIVVRDQRLDIVALRRFANFAAEFAGIGPRPTTLKPNSSEAMRAAATTCVASPKMKTRLPVR